MIWPAFKQKVVRESNFLLWAITYVVEVLCLRNDNFHYYYFLLSIRFLDCSIKAPNCYIPLSLNKSASFYIFEKKEREKEKKSSQNFLTFDSWILLELLCLSKVLICKSCYEPFLLVQCATYTLQLSQSCNFKKIKV